LDAVGTSQNQQDNEQAFTIHTGKKPQGEVHSHLTKSDSVYTATLEYSDSQGTYRFSLDELGPIITSGMASGSIGGSAPSIDGIAFYYYDGKQTGWYTSDGGAYYAKLTSNKGKTFLVSINNNFVQAFPFTEHIKILLLDGSRPKTLFVN
jgi:hypothetical protein